MTEPTNLLPCPFCGSPAEWEYEPWDEETETGDDGMGHIECIGCHIRSALDDKDSATLQWNKRDLKKMRMPNDPPK